MYPQGYAPMELSVERLLRSSTPHSLLRLIPALRTTAQRYISKRSAANLATAWRPPPAAAAAAEGGGAVEALLGTRMGKLLGSVREWWPKRYNSLLECQQVGGYVINSLLICCICITFDVTRLFLCCI